MKNKRNIGLIISYIYFVLNTVLTIFISAFIIRTVGKTDYGVYQSMTAFLSYLVLLEFGTGTLMARNLSLLKKDGTDYETVNKNISTIWSLTIVLAIIICSVAFVFWGLIEVIYSNSMNAEQVALAKKIFVFAAGNTLLSFLNSTLNGLALAYEKYLLEKILSITKLLLRVGLLILTLSLNANVLWVVIIDFGLSLTIFAVMMFFCVFRLKATLVFRYFDKKIFKACLPLAFAMLLQTVVNTANGSVDKFCISVMLKPEDVTIYSVSMAIFTTFSGVATIPISLFMPTIAKTVKTGISGGELTETLVEPCRVNVLITGLLMCGFIAIGRPFLTLLYGADYVESWIYAVIVIIPMFFNMTNGIIINILDIYNKRHIRSYILMGSTVLNIVLTIIGIKFFGMVAAAIATAISLVIQIITLNLYYNKKIGLRIIRLFYKSYKGILFYYLVAMALAFGLTYIIKGAVAQLFVCGFVFIIVSFVLILIFGLTESEKKKRNSILSKIFKKHHT